MNHDILLGAFNHVVGKHGVEIRYGGCQNYAMGAEGHVFHLRNIKIICMKLRVQILKYPSLLLTWRHTVSPSDVCPRSTRSSGRTGRSDGTRSIRFRWTTVWRTVFSTKNTVWPGWTTCSGRSWQPFRTRRPVGTRAVQKVRGT